MFYDQGHGYGDADAFLRRAAVRFALEVAFLALQGGLDRVQLPCDLVPALDRTIDEWHVGKDDVRKIHFHVAGL